MSASGQDEMAHEFVRRPNRAFLGLALPVLLSLIAEPLTGLADTAFVARLGPDALTALGVAVTLLGSLFWVFNFLGVGTQTAVAQADGRGDATAAREAASTAAWTAVALGTVVAVVVWPFLEGLVGFMGATGASAPPAVTYLQIRCVSAPAILLTMASFGALRGLRDMKTPFRIAVALNAVNVLLDGLFIFGWGPIPAWGLAGAAWATVASQWFGAVWAAAAAHRAVGGGGRLRLENVRALFVVGRDLAGRTGLLLLFLLLATRAATQIGPLEASAHQAVRQSWMLAAFLLDAFAASAQSLVGYFLGSGERAVACRVARLACGWSLGAGALLVLVFAVGRDSIAWLFVPPAAYPAFVSVWWIAAVAQPLNAIAFATDGIHWGAGDYRYLRNAMFVATGVASLWLLRLDVQSPDALAWIWIVTDIWIAIRGAAGMIRIWPGVGEAPLRESSVAAGATSGLG